MTKPNAEEVAERSLRQAGYRVYLPRYRRLLAPHGLGRRTVTSMRPLMPGYLFVQDWRGWPGAAVMGVSGMMPGARGAVARLGDGDVALLREDEHLGKWDQVRYPPGAKPVVREDIGVGDAVRVEVGGVLLAATLRELSADGRALVEAMIFCRRTELRVEQEALQVVA